MTETPSTDNQLNNQQPPQQGGMTTSEWGVRTYGEMGQQQAIPGTNIIATHSGGQRQQGGSLLSAEVLTPVVLTIASNQIPKLLRKSRKLGMRGGNLTSIAVPATLVIANQMVSKRLRRKSSKRPFKKSRRITRRR